jgi:hypothetical protein
LQPAHRRSQITPVFKRDTTLDCIVLSRPYSFLVEQP